MSNVEVVLAIVLGLLVNELTDVSPWLARMLVGWSARLRYGDSVRAEVRAEELGAVINDRPGKLFKLGTGLRFLSAALAVRLRRFVTGEGSSADEAAAEDLLPGAGLPWEENPSRLVERFLFPTERYRGEWRRHWIHLVKRLGIVALYAVLGTWAAVERIKPQYAGWVVATVVGGCLLVAAYQVVAWHLSRFVLTNKRLMTTEGVLTRKVAMVPLLRVVDVRYVQSPIARLLNYGTFQLDSAGRRNALRRIANLPNPNELYLRLVEEMYEPAAVEARLGWPDLTEDDESADGAESTRPDPARVQREVIHQIGALSAQLATLAAAIQQLDPAPPRLEQAARAALATEPTAGATTADPPATGAAPLNGPVPAGVVSPTGVQEVGPEPAAIGTTASSRETEAVRSLIGRTAPNLAE